MDYKRFFEIHSRLNGAKKIAVLRTELMDEFVDAIVSDTSIDTEYKTLLLTSLSGGLRISEALALKKTDFVTLDGELYANIKVLKKQKKEERLIKIHPKARPLLQARLSTVIGKPFKLSGRTALRRIQNLVGLPEICNHSLRHSLISFLLFERNMTHMKAAKLIHIGIASMLHYSHLNERKAWAEVF